MSIELLERAAEDLGDEILDEVVFVGAAALALWITDEAAMPLRPTADVDVVVEITTRMGYVGFEERLRARGFRDDGRVICRWHHKRSGLMLDAMPIDARILGFANSWQEDAATHAVEVTLPSGASIRVAPAPYLLATKFEAFQDRGKGDLFGSKDFEDIVALVDGRPGLIEEVGAMAPEARRYVVTEAGRLLEHPRIVEGLEGTLPMGDPIQERAVLVIEPRLHELAALDREGE